MLELEVNNGLKKTYSLNSRLPKKRNFISRYYNFIKDAKAFKYTNDKIIELAKKIDFDKVAAIESRGFVFASTVSYQLEKPFILLRKKINYQQKFILLILN